VTLVSGAIASIAIAMESTKSETLGLLTKASLLAEALLELFILLQALVVLLELSNEDVGTLLLGAVML